jgi:hypothetical protein
MIPTLAIRDRELYMKVSQPNSEVERNNIETARNFLTRVGNTNLGLIEHPRIASVRAFQLLRGCYQSDLQCRKISIVTSGAHALKTLLILRSPIPNIGTVNSALQRTTDSLDTARQKHFLMLSKTGHYSDAIRLVQSYPNDICSEQLTDTLLQYLTEDIYQYDPDHLNHYLEAIRFIIITLAKQERYESLKMALSYITNTEYPRAIKIELAYILTQLYKERLLNYFAEHLFSGILFLITPATQPTNLSLKLLLYPLALKLDPQVALECFSYILVILGLQETSEANEPLIQTLCLLAKNFKHLDSHVMQEELLKTIQKIKHDKTLSLRLSNLYRYLAPTKLRELL